MQEIRLHRPGAELIADSRLAPGSDPYLADYRAEGQTVLPAVMGLEAMAQAAAALAGRPMRHAGQVTFAGPVVVGPDTLIRVCAKREGKRVTTVLRSQHERQWTDHCRAVFQAGTGQSTAGPAAARNGGHPGGAEPGREQPGSGQPGTGLAAARNGCQPDGGQPDGGQPDGGQPDGGQPDGGQPDGGQPDGGQPDGGQPDGGQPDGGQPDGGQPDGGQPDGGQPGGGQPGGGAPGWWTSESATALLDGADLYGPVCFQRGRFRRVAFLPELTSRRVRAVVRGGDDQPWFGAEPGPGEAALQLGSPGLNDATLHVLQACFPHRRMLPAGCDTVTVSGRQAQGAVEVTAIQRPASGLAARPLLAPVQDPDAAPDASAVSSPPGRPVPAGPGTPDEYLWDVTAADASGQPVISWTGLRLRDAGPVPGHPALPPALLGVYLERGATALGLDPALRINVRCEPPPLGPAATGSPWLPALAASPRRPGWVSARSCGQLDELSLRLRAASPAACAWQTADLEDDVRGLERDTEDPEFATLRQRLRDSLAEPALTLHARIRTAIECLSKAGRPVGCDLVVDGCYDDGWALLHAGDALIACTSVRVIGVSYPVAVSIMTGTGLHAAGAA